MGQGDHEVTRLAGPHPGTRRPRPRGLDPGGQGRALRSGRPGRGEPGRPPGGGGDGGSLAGDARPRRRPGAAGFGEGGDRGRGPGGGDRGRAGGNVRARGPGSPGGLRDGPERGGGCRRTSRNSPRRGRHAGRQTGTRVPGSGPPPPCGDRRARCGRRRSALPGAAGGSRRRGATASRISECWRFSPVPPERRAASSSSWSRSGRRLRWPRFLARRGPGLHHVCFEVPDIRATLAALAARGVRLVDREPRPGAGGHLVAFLHPSSTAGVLVELKQATDDPPPH